MKSHFAPFAVAVAGAAALLIGSSGSAPARDNHGGGHNTYRGNSGEHRGYSGGNWNRGYSGGNRYSRSYGYGGYRGGYDRDDYRYGRYGRGFDWDDYRYGRYGGWYAPYYGYSAGYSPWWDSETSVYGYPSLGVYPDAAPALGYTRSYPPAPAYSYQTEGAGTTAEMDVRVPASAQVWVEGQLTNQQGSMRQFESPALQPGQDFRYTLQARWNENGQIVDRTRIVDVHAGDRVTVNFLNPRPEDAAVPQQPARTAPQTIVPRANPPIP